MQSSRRIFARGAAGALPLTENADGLRHKNISQPED
jgi:hypothetical protein